MPATLITLAKFTAIPGLSLGGRPFGNLIVDSNGDLLGTAADAAEIPSGSSEIPTNALFEVAKSPGSEPENRTVLPENIDAEGLVADANGDVFGTTLGGGANNLGSVFEIVKTGSSYSLTTLISFDGADGQAPNGNLFVDLSGDLFGTTIAGDGADVHGTVFEITKTTGDYETTPTTLATFTSDDHGGFNPQGSLIADSQGDLFGTTSSGGANGDGAVFEIKKIAGGYATTATTLTSFSTNVGTIGDVVTDANGDLFGTTTLDHEVFEIVKTPTSPIGYASTPTILASVPIDDGQLSDRSNSLLIDANGDLFGTTDPTSQGFGSVFEIVNTPTGYEKTPRVVISFDGHDGTDPETTLIADAKGDLFGTTPILSGSEPGTVFEVTDSGFVTSPVSPGVPSDLVFQNVDGRAAMWGLTGTEVTDGGAVSSTPGPGWTAVATGDFNADGHADILWQNASTGQASIWEMVGNSLIGGGKLPVNLGPSWHAVVTGDFNDDLRSDIVWQNASTGQLAIWELDGTSFAGVASSVAPNPGAAWKAVGTGDFNDDGDSDIVLRNTTTGQVSIWEMNGNQLKGGGPVSANPGLRWKLVGSGDFNSDGYADLLWQNTSTGQISIWEMNGNSLTGGGTLSANPGASWHAIGAGVEGTASDILFQNTSGQTSIWEMNGTNVNGGGHVGPNPGANWHAIGLGL